MGLNNSKCFEFIKQNIKAFDLNLDDCNLLVPVSAKEPALMAVIAAMAKAKNIYVKVDKPQTQNYIANIANELGFNNIKPVENITDEILCCANIVVKDSTIDKIDRTFLNKLSRKSVISLLPGNLDFNNVEDVDLSAFGKETASLISINPEDKALSLYKYFAHIILKRCYEAGLDIYKSRILLLGHGNFLDTSMQLLKGAGATVYSCNILGDSCQSYISKYLNEIDAIVLIDYPQTQKQLIGSKGIIPISDLVDLNPDTRIIHFAGKVEGGSLKFGKIKCFPSKINQNSINLNISELGERAIVETYTACLKVADNFIKLQACSGQLNNSIVTFNLVSKAEPVLLTKDHRGYLSV